MCRIELISQTSRWAGERGCPPGPWHPNSRPNLHPPQPTRGLRGRAAHAARGEESGPSSSQTVAYSEPLLGYRCYSFFYNILINLSDIVRKFRTSPGATGGGRVAQIPQCPLVTPGMSGGRLSKKEPEERPHAAPHRPAWRPRCVRTRMLPPSWFALVWAGRLSARRGAFRRAALQCCIARLTVLCVDASPYNFRCVIRKHYLRDEDHLCFILLLTLSTVLLLCLNGKIYY